MGSWAKFCEDHGCDRHDSEAEEEPLKEEHDNTKCHHYYHTMILFTGILQVLLIILRSIINTTIIHGDTRYRAIHKPDGGTMIDACAILKGASFGPRRLLCSRRSVQQIVGNQSTLTGLVIRVMHAADQCVWPLSRCCHRAQQVRHGVFRQKGRAALPSQSRRPTTEHEDSKQ